MYVRQHVFIFTIRGSPTTSINDKPSPYTTIFRSPAAAKTPIANSIRYRPGGALRAAAPATRRNREGPPMKVTVAALGRSEEHTSELQSLMRISYAVFCLKKKKFIISAK